MTIDDKAMRFCTGNDCWSLDLASNVVTSIATIKAAGPTSSDADPFRFTLPDGRATTDNKVVSFCPTGPTSCKEFVLGFKFDPADAPRPTVTPDGRFGAVSFVGITEANDPSYVILYDLAKGKKVKQFKGMHGGVYGSAVLIEETGALYSTKTLKRIGKLAIENPDSEPRNIGTTDLIAIGEGAKGLVVIQDTKTGKSRATIKLDAKAPDAHRMELVASRDGSKLYAIAGFPNEGDVSVIDVAGSKIVTRVAPPTCAPNTKRD